MKPIVQWLNNSLIRGKTGGSNKAISTSGNASMGIPTNARWKVIQEGLLLLRSEIEFFDLAVQR